MRDVSFWGRDIEGCAAGAAAAGDFSPLIAKWPSLLRPAYGRCRPPRSSERAAAAISSRVARASSSILTRSRRVLLRQRILIASLGGRQDCLRD